MSKLVPIGAAAKAFCVSTSTLRRWEAAGRLAPTRTERGQRRYAAAALLSGIHPDPPRKQCF
ncbi:MerR family DNA-binding transcriptional regulator [Massilia sp. YIM B02443]|uniref:MerR family DNA-binding transcriptional regulator n=1 Tax=Massilia sp. YIM B02443 TaxID=3050127 RepID=UPI0035A6F905